MTASCAASSTASTCAPPAPAGRQLVAASASRRSRSSYVDLLVPGLLAMAIAQSAAFGVAFSLVAWRQKGMLRRLRLTPLPLREFAAGRVLFPLMIALVQAVILLTVGRVLFGVHLVGNLLALMPLVLLGALCFIALGMCIGGRVNTEDATAALSNLIVLPMMFLGGVFFPLSSAPGAVRVIAHFLPLTYLADGLQDVAVRGHSFASTLPNLGRARAFAVVLAALALRRFRWNDAVTTPDRRAVGVAVLRARHAGRARRRARGDRRAPATRVGVRRSPRPRRAPPTPSTRPMRCPRTARRVHARARASSPARCGAPGRLPHVGGRTRRPEHPATSHPASSAACPSR